MKIGELRDWITLLPADGEVTVEVEGPYGIESLPVVRMTRINPCRGAFRIRLGTDPIPRRPMEQAPRLRGRGVW